MFQLVPGLALIVAAFVAGEQFAPVVDLHEEGAALGGHDLAGVCHRHGVSVLVKGCGGVVVHPGFFDKRRVVRLDRQRGQGGLFDGEGFPDGQLPASDLVLGGVAPAAFQDQLVEFVPVPGFGDGHQDIAPDVADQPLNEALFVPF